MQNGSIMIPFVLPYADGLRVIAVIVVIALHASAIRVVHLPEVNSFPWWIANIIDSMSRWAVPVFIMLSGALLLDVNRKYTLLGFYEKRFSRVVIPFIFWVAFYFYWSDRFYGMDITPEFIRESIWDGISYNHLYFLFIITGLYFVTPLLRLLIKHRIIYDHWALALVLLYLAESGTLYNYVPMVGVTKFIPFIPYFLLGYLLRHEGIRAKSGILFLMGYVVSSAVIALVTYQLIDQFGKDDLRSFVMYDHFNACVIIQSVCIFLLAQRIFHLQQESFLPKLLTVLSPITFGIYLLHVVFLDVFRIYTVTFNLKYILPTIILEVAVVFVVSALASMLLSKIPVVKTIVGL